MIDQVHTQINEFGFVTVSAMSMAAKAVLFTAPAMCRAPERDVGLEVIFWAVAKIESACLRIKQALTPKKKNDESKDQSITTIT